MTRSLIPRILIPAVLIAAVAFSLLGPVFAQPAVVILHDGVAVDAPPHCGAREVYDGTRWTFVWPCIVFRQGFEK